jgi:hypothetical protein
MAADPVSAGRKGGSRNTPAQQAARRRNGFQRVYPPKTTGDSTEQILVETDSKDSEKK